jgi:hypothetical protein
VRCLKKTSDGRESIEEWEAQYLKPLKDWRGEGWSPSDIAAEWTKLQTAENELLAGYSLVISNLVRHSIFLLNCDMS